MDGRHKGPIGALADPQARFCAISFSGKAGHFLKLAERVKAAAFLAIANDLEAVTFQLRDSVELLGGRRVEVDHGRPADVSARLSAGSG